MKLLLTSSSLLTDRVLLFSSFAQSITAEANVEVWATSFPQNKDLWELQGYQISSFPKVKNFRERFNMLRFVNHHLWNYKLEATSLLSMHEFSEKQAPLKNKIKRRFERNIGWFLNKIGMGIRFESWLIGLLCKQTRSEEARDRMINGKFDGIVITNPFWTLESAIAIEAAKLNIPIFSLIPSWDNITTKSRLVFKSDAFAVWSEIRIKEFRKYYPIFNKVPVYAVGAPQFDVFFNSDLVSDKASFCQKHGLRTDLPILLYCIGSPNFIKSEITTCISSLTYFAENGLLNSMQVLIRPHPNKHNSEGESEYLSIHENIKIQNVGLHGLLTEKRSQTKDQISEWITTFTHIDFVANLSSTVILDAAYFNKPIINIDFDCEGERIYNSFIKFLNRNWIHLQSIYQSNAIDYVDSNEGFYQTLKRIIEKPNEKMKERVSVRKLICNNENGKSGELLAKKIIRTFAK